MSNEGSRRERKKEKTRWTLQDTALRLFLEQGYEATTVAQIADAAGVSQMTFFRYFPTKEDVVLNDEYDPAMEAVIRSMPTSDPPVPRLHSAITSMLKEVYPDNRDALFQRARLLLTTPALRARLPESLSASQTTFERALAEPGADLPLRARVAAATYSATRSTAVAAGVVGGGADELPDVVEDAFRAVCTNFPQPGGSAR